MAGRGEAGMAREHLEDSHRMVDSFDEILPHARQSKGNIEDSTSCRQTALALLLLLLLNRTPRAARRYKFVGLSLPCSFPVAPCRHLSSFSLRKSFEPPQILRHIINRRIVKHNRKLPSRIMQRL